MEAPRVHSPSLSEDTLGTVSNEPPTMFDTENEGRRIVINNGRTQGEMPSAVGICAPRERVGRHGQVHQQELEVGA